MDQELLFELSDHVALITLNRPEVQNTLSPGLLDGLAAAYRRCDEDDEVRVVVVTGAGNSFCAGADMTGGGSTFDGEAIGEEVDSCPLTMQAWQVRKPVIAACNGHAIGAGLGLAMQADMRVFAAEGKYGFLQSRRGVVADFAIEYVLPRLIGYEKAFELLVRAPRLTGEEAEHWGLAGRVVPASDVLAVAMDIAADMALNCAPLPMGMHKQLLWRGYDMSRSELARLESMALNLTLRTPDAIEGGMAYFERRKPQWTGSVTRDWPQWLDD